MQINHYLLVFAALAVIATGCEKSGRRTGDPSLTAVPTLLEFEASGSEMSKTVTVTTNRDWRIVEELDEIGWLRATVDGKSISGVRNTVTEGPVLVTITVEDNDSFPREQVLTFNGGTKARSSVTVKQEGNIDYDTIGDIIEQYKAQSKDTLVLSGVMIKAVVISSTEQDNLASSKSLYIQDETAGINVFCAANHSFAFGDEVVFNLDGVAMIKYAGVPEITAFPLDAATTLSTGKEVEPEEIEVSDMTTGEYEAMYVKINDVQVADSDLGKTWVMNSAATSINMVTRTGDTFVVRSGKYSSYGTETVAQGSGCICGICTTFNGTPQIIFAQDSDRQQMTDERFGEEESDMVIDPSSVTLPANGGASQLKAAVSVTCSRDWSVSTEIPEWLTVTSDGQSVEDVTFPGSSTPVELTVTVAANTGMPRAVSLVLNDRTSTKNTLSISQEGTVSYNTLSEIISEYKIAGKDTIKLDGKAINPIVISNSELDNLSSSKSMYVQDGTAGINIFCNANHSLKFGDKVVVDLNGAILTKYMGSFEICQISPDAFTVAASGLTVEPELIGISDMTTGIYEGMYVRINDVQVVDSDLDKTWVVNSSSTSITVENKDGETFVVRSGKYSSYKDETVAQGSGYICGICTTYNGAAQIIFSQDDDRKHMTGSRFQPETSTLTVAEVVAAGAGNGITEGRVIAIGSKGLVINDGGSQFLYSYTGSTPDVSVGDIVKIEGAFKTYNGCVEYSEPAVSSSTASIPTSPTPDPKVLTGADITSYTGDKSSELVKFGGTLTVSGKYVNVAIDGSSIGGSLESAEDLSAYDGQSVQVTGYFSGKSSSWFSVVVKDIEVSSDPFLTIDPEGALTVSCSATSQTLKIKSNIAWTVSSDNPDFTPDVNSGTGNGTVTLTFPANTDPAGEKVAVVTVSSELGSRTLTITQKKYVEAKNFVKVTSAPSDWSGTYLAVFTKDSKYYAFDGSLTSDVAGNYVEVTVSGSEIEYSEDLVAKTITLAKVDGGYSVQLAAGKYIYGTNNSNKINFSDEAKAVSVTMAEDLVTLSSGEKSNFQMYISSSGSRVRFYKSSQTLPSLYKIAD